MINEKIGTNDSIDISVVRGEPKEVLKKFIMDAVTAESAVLHIDDSTFQPILSAVVKLEMTLEFNHDWVANIGEDEFHRILGEVILNKIKEKKYGNDNK